MHVRILLLPIILLVFGACYDSPLVTIREPGVYKGTVDPLLEKQKQPQRQELLKERLLLVQTDR